MRPRRSAQRYSAANTASIDVPRKGLKRVDLQSRGNGRATVGSHRLGSVSPQSAPLVDERDDGGQDAVKIRVVGDDKIRLAHHVIEFTFIRVAIRRNGRRRAYATFSEPLDAALPWRLYKHEYEWRRAPNTPQRLHRADMPHTVNDKRAPAVPLNLTDDARAECIPSVPNELVADLLKDRPTLTEAATLRLCAHGIAETHSVNRIVISHRPGHC